MNPYTLQQQLHRSSGFVSWIPLAVSVCRGLLGGSLRVSPSRTLNWRSPGQPPVRVFRGNQGDVSPSGAKPTTKGDVSILVALASIFLAPFSPFLAAHSPHPPEHPSLSRLCAFLESARGLRGARPLFLPCLLQHLLLPNKGATNPLLMTMPPSHASRKPLCFFWRPKSYRTCSLEGVKTKPGGWMRHWGLSPSSAVWKIPNWEPAGQGAAPLPLRLFSLIIFIRHSPRVFPRRDLLAWLWQGGSRPSTMLTTHLPPRC